jgi:hypothetical protein
VTSDSGHVDDFSAADYTTNTEEARNKVNQGTKFRSFLRKGARNRRSKIIKEPQKTYQYYSNAVAKTFSTADSIADGTFQTSDVFLFKYKKIVKVTLLLRFF